jgi:hypothetical protein
MIKIVKKKIFKKTPNKMFVVGEILVGFVG